MLVSLCAYYSSKTHARMRLICTYTLQQKKHLEGGCYQLLYGLCLLVFYSLGVGIVIIYFANQKEKRPISLNDICNRRDHRAGESCNYQKLLFRWSLWKWIAKHIMSALLCALQLHSFIVRFSSFHGAVYNPQPLKHKQSRQKKQSNQVKKEYLQHQ